MNIDSARFSPIARTRKVTSPLEGCLEGISSIFKTSFRPADFVETNYLSHLIFSLSVIFPANYVKDQSCYRPYSARNTSAARSPIMTHGAMVLPVVTRGMIDPSAIRSRSMP